MSVRAIVEAWEKEVTDGDVRELLRVVWSTVEKAPECIDGVCGINARSWYTSPWQALEAARRHVAESWSTESTTAWLDRAQRVSLDVSEFAAELRRRGVVVPVCLGGTPHRDAPVWHSPDYRSVRWHGVAYSFNEVQAKVVEALWYDWESRGAGLGESWLLDIVESVRPDRTTARLQTTFGGGSRAKQHKAWDTMIKRVRMRTYALVPAKE